jgi:hypothetical protein
VKATKSFHLSHISQTSTFAVFSDTRLCEIRICEKEKYVMQIEWAVIPRGDYAFQQQKIYVTLNRNGEFKMNEMTWKKTGAPAAFLVMFNRVNNLIALKPTAASMKDAYPARKTGRRNARVIRVARLLTEHKIKLPDTIEFHDAEIDVDGQLILDLRTARVSARAHSQCRMR